MKYIILCVALGLLSGCNQAEKAAAKESQQIRREAEKTRIEQWAYIAKEKQVSATEHIKLLVIPTELGEFFDTKCLIYTNSEYKQSHMSCLQDDINKPGVE